MVVPGHRVVLNFEGGIFAQLICPGDGRCLVKKCPACKADLTKAGSKRCDACEEINPDECWLKSWFDAMSGEELLAGKIEFPVWAEQDGDQPLVHIVPVPAPDEPPQQEEAAALRELEAVADAARAWAADEYPGGHDQAAEFTADRHALAVIDALAALDPPPSDLASDHPTEAEKLRDILSWAESMLDSYSAAPQTPANKERLRRYFNLAVKTRALLPVGMTAPKGSES
jgi:hypothetical protein